MQQDSWLRRKQVRQTDRPRGARLDEPLRSNAPIGWCRIVRYFPPVIYALLWTTRRTVEPIQRYLRTATVVLLQFDCYSGATLNVTIVTSLAVGDRELALWCDERGAANAAFRELIKYTKRAFVGLLWINCWPVDTRNQRETHTLQNTQLTRSSNRMTSLIACRACWGHVELKYVTCSTCQWTCDVSYGSVFNVAPGGKPCDATKYCCVMT